MTPIIIIRFFVILLLRFARLKDFVCIKSNEMRRCVFKRSVENAFGHVKKTRFGNKAE